jgi:hypothetical protein
MQPINFEGVTKVYAKDQPEYLPLPVCQVPGIEGEVISVWKPTDEERLAIANGANIGLSCWTFHRPLQPVRVFVADHAEIVEEPPATPQQHEDHVDAVVHAIAANYSDQDRQQDAVSGNTDADSDSQVILSVNSD